MNQVNQLPVFLGVLIFAFALNIQNVKAQGVGINKDNSAPDPSAMLDVKSDTKGAVFPRMNQAQRDAINSPAEGLLVYQTDGKKGYYYHDGTAWQLLPSQNSSAPTGTIVSFGGAKAKIPAGWKLCDGAEVSRTSQQYKDLFEAIGTAWGQGNGTTTFHLPDLRGIFLRGVNDTRTGTYADPNATTRTTLNGGNSGDKVGSLQGHQFKQHSHNVNINGNTNHGGEHTHGYGHSVLDNSGKGDSDNDKIYDGLSWDHKRRTTTEGSAHSHSFTVSGATQSAGGSETRPNNAYVHYIIKL